jgi:glycosyltransferase involved in cell wall biosynthesis
VLVTTRARGTNVPLKVYQYLRAGRPIVATAIRAHTQVLDAGTAELVDAEPHAIAAGILRVVRDPAHARRLATAAASLAHDQYGESRYLERLDDVLRRVVRCAPGHPSVTAPR